MGFWVPVGVFQMALRGGRGAFGSGQDEARTSVHQSQPGRGASPSSSPSSSSSVHTVLRRFRAQLPVLENPQGSKDVMTVLDLQVEKSRTENDKPALQVVPPC